MMMTHKSPAIIVRGAIINDGRILLCNVKGKDWYFLPGGKAEEVEDLDTALARELREETAQQDFNISSLICVVNNEFTENSVLHKGVEYIFAVSDMDIEHVVSQEPHIEFSVHPIEELDSIQLLPSSLKRSLKEWFYQQSRGGDLDR